jgi:UPF0716 protein FxsA
VLVKLLLLFLLVPAIELFLLVEIGQRVGTLPTIGLVIFTGLLGAFLARREGLQVLSRLRAELAAGQLPADSIFDGVIILVASVLLITPGVLTDIVALLCLIPVTRRLIKSAVWTHLERMIRNGQIFTTTYRGIRYQDRPEDVIILDQDDYKQQH